VESIDVGTELIGDHLGSEVGRGSSVDEELVLGETLAVHVRHGDGRGFRTDARELEACAIRHQKVGKLASENVLRKPPEESGWHPEPG